MSFFWRSNAPERCSTRSYAAKIQDGDKAKIVVRPKRCNSWRCKRCRPRLSYSWGRAVETYFDTKQIRFLTLTMDSRVTVADSFAAAATAWNRLRGQITRQYGKFKYVRVLEVQPGTQKAHYHLLVDCYIEQRWLSRTAEQAGFGKIVDIRLLHSNGVVAYVAKYLRKANKPGTGSNAMVEANARRISGGKGFVMVRYNRRRGGFFVRDFNSGGAVEYASAAAIACHAAGWNVDVVQRSEGCFELQLSDADPGGMESAEWNEKALEIELDLITWRMI